MYKSQIPNKAQISKTPNSFVFLVCLEPVVCLDVWNVWVLVFFLLITDYLMLVFFFSLFLLFIQLFHHVDYFPSFIFTGVGAGSMRQDHAASVRIAHQTNGL